MPRLLFLVLFLIVPYALWRVMDTAQKTAVRVFLGTHGPFALVVFIVIGMAVLIASGGGFIKVL